MLEQDENKANGGAISIRVLNFVKAANFSGNDLRLVSQNIQKTEKGERNESFA